MHIQREEETDVIIFLNIISRKLKSYSHILQERKVRDDRYYCCPLTVVLLCFCLNQSFVMLILICLNQVSSSFAFSVLDRWLNLGNLGKKLRRTEQLSPSRKVKLSDCDGVKLII